MFRAWGYRAHRAVVEWHALDTAGQEPPKIEIVVLV